MRAIFLLIVVEVICMMLPMEQAVAQATQATTPLDVLLPVPAQVKNGIGCFRLNKDFQIAIAGVAELRLYHATTRMLRRLAGRTGLFFTQDYLVPGAPTLSPTMIVACERKGELTVREDESYALTVTPQTIELKAVCDLGVLRGLETLLQLLQADATGYYFPEVAIVDRPRFAWRGLLMDVCRHFMPVEVIKRNLDGMAAVKLNVFHWHLTEDQGFRVASKLFPKLHEQGSDGQYYTQEQVKMVIAYAADRGIRVVPEFDMPGHATSWFVGHPELASAPGPYRVERKFGIMYAAMDPTKEATYTFLDAFLGEMAALFPDEYLHIGGDENNGKQWRENAEIQSFMQANNIVNARDLQMAFNQRILKILQKYGKKLIGWDEILHSGMPKDIVIQSWRGSKFLVESARQGYMGILSNGYYIDLMQTAEFHYLNDPIPPDTALNAIEQKQILGGEATMWAELVTPENVDSRIWPRTAAIAERLWSPATVRDVESMYRRLGKISVELEELGLCHRKNYEMMLRRLSNFQDEAALKTLVDLVEPLKIYQRHRQGIVYTSVVPLTRVVDAARPDSEVAREFARLVSRFLENPAAGDYETIKHRLVAWGENHHKLLPVIRRSPILKEIEPLSATLAEISQIGLVALDRCYRREALDENWSRNAMASLQQAKKICAETELMIVMPIEKIVVGAVAMTNQKK